MYYIVYVYVHIYKIYINTNLLTNFIIRLSHTNASKERLTPSFSKCCRKK